MSRERAAWVTMLALLSVYVVGLVLGWADFASWHLLLVIVAILLIYNLLRQRGNP